MKRKMIININLPHISKIFLPIVMNDLIEIGYSKYLSEIFINSGFYKEIEKSMTFSQVLNWIYDLLFKNYRNEYVYKNAIANKILLGKHSINTSLMLSEFRAGNCKADVVIINGTSTVYEIKSKYDSFKRLDKQLKAYLEIFDLINIITSRSQLEKVKSILPEKVGLLVLTDRNTISTIREPVSNKKYLIQDKLFDSLKKNEYIAVIKRYYDFIPDVPNTQLFKICKKLFNKIDPIQAHDLVFDVLRSRCELNDLKKLLNKSPNSLTAYIMSISNQREKLQKLIPLLNHNFHSILFQ